MKRSEVNEAICSAEGILREHRFALPDFANWTKGDRARERERAAWLSERQIGWDVTDFGSGDFARRGLTLFCVRNGLQGVPGERPYAEKLLFVGDGQETPFHAHRVKLEDIIVRGGGTLCVEFSQDGSFEVDPAGAPAGCAIIDGAPVPAFGRVHRLGAGQSITVPRGLQHRFWGEGATVFVAEVSQCNDDMADNYFLGDVPRFAGIEEDEEPLRTLWNEPV
jgi:D-lyxose ketol-isomerase